MDYTQNDCGTMLCIVMAVRDGVMRESVGAISPNVSRGVCGKQTPGMYHSVFWANRHCRSSHPTRLGSTTRVAPQAMANAQ
jgi:hypothetical protein